MASFDSKESLIDKAKAMFEEKFSTEPSACVFAPGRVNLIGEHTDYNDGFVLPFALPFKTVIVGSLSSKKDSQIFSTIVGVDSQSCSFDISEMAKGSPEWANYIKGTIAQYLNDIPKDASINAVVVSNVPIGAGLSSSAALEVATATLLEKLFNITSVTGVDKALRCQKAEHEWADTPCGIMDQYISAMGKEGNLLLIDCRSREYKLVPFGKDGPAPLLLVTNSNIKHKLSGSEYPDRVRQCREAVDILKASNPSISALRDVTIDMIELSKEKLPELSYKRAKHCVTEDLRTLQTVELLGTGDFNGVGKNMTASHCSLRDDFEVSCAELDTLVELALQVPGVYGSRMTGGGFGGCTVTLIDSNAVDNFKRSVGEKYRDLHGVDCVFYTASPSEGASYM